MRKELIDKALQHTRPGDILFMASEQGDSDSADLFGAANHLRNLMAYSGAVEVFDLALSAEPDHVRALEQKALCLARQGSDFSGKAEDLLDRAISLAGGAADSDSESVSILARLNKERWCRSWISDAESGSDEDIEDACRSAAGESFYLWSAIDLYLDAFEQTQSYYTAINAATLLSIAIYLNERVPNAQPRPASVAVAQRDELFEKAAPIIAAATDAANAHGDEGVYWALATQLEWSIVSGDVSDDEGVAGIPLQASTLIRKAGLRRFLLDSTVGQFRIFRALGFQAALSGPALESLQTALNFTPDPSVPRHRIVYLPGQVDDSGCFRLVDPGEAQSADVAQIEEQIRAVWERDHDLMVLVPATSSGSIAAAEYCKASGIAFEFFSPVEADALHSDWLGRESGDESGRFSKVRRKARAFSVLQSSVGESEAAANDRLLQWMFDNARVYGADRVTALLDVDQAITAIPGAALSVGESGGLLLSDKDQSRMKADAPAPAPAPQEPAPSVPAPAASDIVVSEPSVDTEIACFYDYCSREETRTRWNSYTDDARSFLMSIGLNFEPFGLVAPVLLERNTLGFELLTEGPNGMRYGDVMAERDRLGIEQLDVELVVLLKGLNAIQSLRRRLRLALGIQADSLLMSVNVADMMMKSPEFVEVIARYRLDETSLFEVHEGLAMENVARVRQLADTYRLRLALDDSNDMAPDVRDALFDKVDLIKVDFKFTREKLARVGDESPENIIEELVQLRQPDMPLVIEGIESEQDIIFIQNHWKKDYGYLYCQGWAVQVSGLLKPFFEPVGTPDFPKGYRLLPE